MTPLNVVRHLLVATGNIIRGSTRWGLALINRRRSRIGQPPLTRGQRAGVVVFTVFAAFMVAAVLSSWRVAATPQPVTATPSAAVVAQPAPFVPACHSLDTVYDGEPTCHRGGELVTVARVIDGDTVQLSDGRRVRILGVDTPEAKDCAGPGATEFTKAKVAGQTVKLHREPGVDLDRYGRTLGYLQYGPPHYATDLGQELILARWAIPYDGDANPTYMARIHRNMDNAKGISAGMFAPPCGKPEPLPAPAPANGSDVDAPHVNLPDGALTGGYCARKWWC